VNIALVYHKVDLDGLCSGAIVKDRFAGDNFKEFPYNYGEPFDPALFEVYDQVIIVDFSFLPAEMKQLKEVHGERLIWIDHHDRAIKTSEAEGYSDIPGVRVSGIGACALTWGYFNPEMECPEVIISLAKYDVWKLTPLIRAVHAYMDVSAQTIDAPIWQDVLAGRPLEYAVGVGSAIVLRNDQEMKRVIRSGRYVQVDGYTFIAVNYHNATMLSEADVKIANADALVVYNRNPKDWGVHFRGLGKDIDLAQYAHDRSIKDGAERPGGGHHDASGYKVKTLPEWLA